MQRSRNRIYLIPIILSFLFVLLFPVGVVEQKSKAENREYNLKIHYIDVGQGDCSFIELPDGKTMLIDAGQEDQGKHVVKYIKKLGYSKIDYVVATHADSDHVGGLAKVIESFEVEVVYRPFTLSNCVTVKDFKDELLELFQADETINSTASSEAYAKFLKSAYNETCGNKLCEIRICSDKEVVISNDAENPYMIKFFMPYGKNQFVTNRIVNGYTVEKTAEENDLSAVIEIIAGQHKYLFTGDMTSSAENILIENLSSSEREMISNVSVLKVAHHGSSSSTSSKFLDLVRPVNAIIMVGKDNEYKLPADSVISRLENVAATIYRTDKLGSVIVEEKEGILIFNTIATRTIYEKYSWLLYTALIVTTIVIIFVIALYPKWQKKKMFKKDSKKSLNQSVDKK